jgi:outer membrane protein OmpA-like peptidoglycan-associated protein
MQTCRLKQAALVLAALVLLYAAAGFLLMPWLIEHRLAPWLQQRLGQSVSVGTVRVNPFLLTLSMRDVRIEGPHDSPVVAFDQLSTDMAWAGLFRRTWTLDTLTLQGLQVHLVREPGGRLNLAELAQRLAGQDGKPGEGAQAAVLHQLDVSQARLVFTDLTGDQPVSATIAPLSLQATGLSNMANQRATYSVKATLPDEGALDWRGEAILQPALQTTGDVQLRGLQAGALWPFLHGQLGLSEVHARADLSARYAYGAGQSLQLQDMAFDLSDVLMARTGEDGRLLAIKRITAGGGSLDLARRTAALQTLAFDGGETTVALAPDGRMNWALGGPSPARQVEPAGQAQQTEPAVPDWTLEVAALRIDQVGVHYRDRRKSLLALDIGELSGSLQLSLAGGAATRVQASGIDARLQQTTLQTPGALQAGLTLASARLEQGQFNLQDQRLTARQLSLDDGQVSLVRSQGVSSAQTGPPGAGGAGSRTAVAASSLRIHASAQAGALIKTLNHSRQVGIGPQALQPAAAQSLGGAGNSSGDAKAAGASWTFQVDSLRLNRIGAQMTDRSRPTPLVLRAGAIDGHARLRLMLGASTPQLALEDLNAQLQQLELAPSGIGQPSFALAFASLAGGRLDLAAQRVGASELVLKGGAASIVRHADGRLALPGLPAPATPMGEGLNSPSVAPASASPSPSGAASWQYDLGLVRLESLEVKLADRSFTPPLAVGVTLQASAKNVASDRAATFDATMSLASGGTARASGKVAPGAANVQAQVEVTGLALAPLQPLLAKFAALDIRSGAVSASSGLRYQGGAPAVLQAQGRVGIANLLVNEAGSDQRFLSWKQLDAESVAFDLASRRFTVQEVTVNAPGAKIEIAKDRSVNLAKVFRRDPPARPQSGPADVQPKAAANPPWDLRVERVRLQGGEVDYADLSLVLPFSTTVKALDGTVIGISNDKSRRADIQASGTIEPYGSASVNGSITPFAPAQFTDLHVLFNNVLVPPLSPYTATFAGRKVESGKLWLDLQYKVAGGELQGENSIRLADFTLGERVNAPSAISVPLDLAVALLTDAKGEIRLSVPVRGNLDNPSFNVGSAVRQALGNVLQRLVTAPFRAIGRLFGGNAESLEAIDFTPGSAALRPEQREKLDALSRALQERPRLQLVVSAPYDPQTDALALQREQATRELAKTLGRKLEANQDPGPIAYDDPATRRVLERMFGEQTGADAVRQLDSDFAGAGDASRKRYEAMFEKITATRALDESATQRLAAQRAQTIASYLVQQGVGRERVQTGRITAVQGGSAGAVSAQLQIAATGTTG